MSTGKTVAATVNTNAESREVREAQERARREEAKRRAKQKYYDNEIDKRFQTYRQLQQQLDKAKTEYADLVFNLPNLDNISPEADINAMRQWVSKSKSSLKTMKKNLDNEIKLAHERHLARIKLAETWQRTRSYHAEASAIYDAITQVANEYGKVNATNKITMPDAPILLADNATQDQLDKAIPKLQQHITQLQQHLIMAENQLFTHHNLQTQRGKQLQAVHARNRLQAQKVAERKQARQQLSQYAMEQAKQQGIDLPPYVAVMSEHYLGGVSDIQIKRCKEEIYKQITKEKKRISYSNKAMQMLNNPPANELGDVELAKRWEGLKNSLIKVTQRDRHYLTGFEKLEKTYDYLKVLNQRLINDAYIQATLEEQLSKAGLNMVTTATGATIYGDSDDVVIEAKRVKTNEGVVIETQQVFADDLSNEQIRQLSRDTCQRLKHSVDNVRAESKTEKGQKNTHRVTSAIQPSADDGKVIKRRRQQMQQQRRMAL